MRAALNHPIRRHSDSPSHTVRVARPAVPVCFPKLRWSDRQKCEVLRRSVLSEPVVLARHLLRLLAKQLTELVWSERLDLLAPELLSELASSVLLRGAERDVLLPLDVVGGDGAARDSGASRAVLARVPCAAEAVVIWVLVHGQRLVVDAGVSGRVPHARLVSVLPVPACLATVGEAAPEVTDVMAPPGVVPAVSLSLDLHVPSA